MKWFITGGTGFVGSHAVEAVRARGWDAVCLVRSPTRAAFLERLGATLIEGDLDDVQALDRGVAGADVVLHAAGLVKAQRVEQFFRTNERGTANLVAAAQRHLRPGRRFVVISSQAAAGPSVDGVPIDEAATPRPLSPYGSSKLAAERVALAHEAALAVSVVRPPTIYGPRDREGLTAFRLIKYGVHPRIGVRAMSIVHVLDLVDAIIRVATSSSSIGRTYFVANPSPVEMVALGAMIAAAMGRRALPLPVPGPALMAAAWVAEMVGALTGHSVQFDRHKAVELSQPFWTCSSARITRELGWTARIALADGLAETVRWYREHRWL